MPKIKKERRVPRTFTNSSNSSNEQKKYMVGTMLAVDLYGHGNFFETVVQNTTDLKIKGVVKVQYFDNDNTVGTVDLNETETVELVKENILTLEEGSADANLSDDEKGFLGRRLTVQWEDNQRYSGTIIKTLKNQKNFVFINYDDGDKVWYNLSPDKEQADEDEDKNDRESASKSSAKIKNESSLVEEGGSSPSRKSNSAKKVSGSQLDPKFEKARRDLAKRYPIGCTIAVDSYHDEHFHEAIVRKYIPNPTKAQQAKGEQWVYLHWLDKDKTKNWVDLNCINAIKIIPEEILRLDEVKPSDDKGFLGKRIVVQWKDENKYCGLATKSSKDNKYFVFLEYDDGDQCWCDLQRESYWSIDGEDFSDEDDDDDDIEGSSSSDENSTKPPSSRTEPKRKASSETTCQSNKKTRLPEESYDL